MLLGPLTFVSGSKPRIWWAGDLDHDQAPEMLLVREKGKDKTEYIFLKSAPAGEPPLLEARVKGVWLR